MSIAEGERRRRDCTFLPIRLEFENTFTSDEVIWGQVIGLLNFDVVYEPLYLVQFKVRIAETQHYGEYCAERTLPQLREGKNLFNEHFRSHFHHTFYKDATVTPVANDWVGEIIAAGTTIAVETSASLEETFRNPDCDSQFLYRVRNNVTGLFHTLTYQEMMRANICFHDRLEQYRYTRSDLE